MDVSLPHAERALIAEAERLGASLRGRSPEIAAARRLPPDVVGALGRARLFALCVPRSLGGPETRVETLVRAVEAVAAGDAAAGWCVAIAATSGLLAAYLPPEAAQEVFGAPDAVAGGVFAPRGRAVRTPEGYRVTGRWSFASGCEHCTWLMGGCSVEGEGGRPDVRLFLFPASAARIHDTWDVAGLEGTGSHDIEVEDLLVAGSHAVSLVSDRPREPGPLYAFPPFGLLAVGVASVALGIGRRALEEIRDLAARKTPALATRRLAERPATQARIAQAAAALGSGRTYLLDTVRRVWEEATSGGALDTQARARVRLAASWAVRAATGAVDAAYALGGGSAIYRSSPLQRLFRDVHTVTAHAMVADPTFELVGRVLLGVDVDTSML
jgi:alkylation response protein AidB-like acyl-CoA dehydrogenase